MWIIHPLLSLSTWSLYETLCSLQFYFPDKFILHLSLFLHTTYLTKKCGTQTTTELFCNYSSQGGILSCEMLEENKKGLHDVTLPNKNINPAFPGLKHKVYNHVPQRLKTSWVFINTVPKYFSMGISDAQKFAGLPFLGKTKARGWAMMWRLGLCSFTSQAKSISVTNTKKLLM